MFKLRPYQQAVVDENRRLWSEGVQNPCSVLPTGSGKTVVASELIRMEQNDGGYFAALAHRQELVGQISLALAQQGVLHDIIAPRPVIRFCSDMHVRKLGQCYYSKHAPGFVGGVDTLIRRDVGRIKDTVSLLFQDECFPAGTAIRCPEGDKPIEDIEIGDMVLAFDEKTTALVPRKVTRLFKNPAPAVMVQIIASSAPKMGYTEGDVLTTLGHPFWTQRGWVEAGLLTNRDKVLVGRCWRAVKSTYNVLPDSSCCPDGYVYNIEVDELHTYVANGVVVHNCHHVLADNKWGKAAQLFPRAKGLYVTATPLRADGKGLGRHADGLFDRFIIGPPMRQLIREGNLTDYRIFAPPSDIDLAGMAFGSNGDYSQPELRKRAKKSHIVGDTVNNYVKYASGTQCVVFAIDVESSNEIVKNFVARGIAAVALSANNTDAERQDALTKFADKNIQVIVNVDLLGEGFDCPAIETVIMARPTASYGLYVQQFGRALRLLEGKDYGLIIDMVGNVKRHGLPDAPRDWSLDRREKRGKGQGDSVPAVKICPECMAVYQVGPSACPFCGKASVVGGGRGELVMVDAELRELSAEELASMRGEADKLVNEWSIRPGMSKSQVMSVHSHNKTVGAQKRLRDTIAMYAGAMRAAGVPDEMIHVQMYQTYGTNVNEAQTLRPTAADDLAGRIERDLAQIGVTV